MVGFRAFAHSRARTRGLTGYVSNLPTGQVQVVAEGDRALLEEFLADLKRGPRSAQVSDVEVSWERPKNEFHDFSVRFGRW